jgi:hypothetical protein
MTDLVSLFSQDALFQGIDPRLRVGPAEIFQYYDEVAEGTTATVHVLHGVQLGQVIVSGFTDVDFTGCTGEVHLIRLSVVAECVEGTWLIRQYHAARRP